MVYIVNPTDQVVTIVINGITYSVEPKSASKPLPREAAEKWKMIHGFLSISDAPAQVAAEEKKEEAKEVAAPEAVAESVSKPVSRRSKK